MSEFTDELKKLDLAINLPSKTYFAIEERFKDWQPPKKLVEVPKCVADWFEDNKENLEDATWEYIRDWSGQRCDAFYNWFNEDYRPIETLIRMGLDGYTVKKEQMFYLKNKNTGHILYRQPKEAGGDFIEVVATINEEYTWFTQYEIDTMHTGSYEQISVKVGEA